MKQYISKYSNDKSVSAAQYITELICENKAKKDKADLHYRFWLSKKWSAFFRNQIASAHKLLKQYGDTAIVRALKDPRASQIYSLRAPHLIPIIEYQKEKLDQENNQLTIEINRSDNIKFGKNETDKRVRNILNKLKDLDNE